MAGTSAESEEEIRLMLRKRFEKDGFHQTINSLADSAIDCPGKREENVRLLVVACQMCGLRNVIDVFAEHMFIDEEGKKKTLISIIVDICDASSVGLA